MDHYQAAMPNARECLAGDCITDQYQNFHSSARPNLLQLLANIAYCNFLFVVVTATDTHDALLCSLQAGSAWHVTSMGPCHLPQQV